MLILGIETSCDETAICFLEIKEGRFKILSNIVSSQVRIHQKYGGVVPEKAARKHLEIILLIIKQGLSEVAKNSKELSKLIKKIDTLAVTIGPGLMTSLLVGTETAKTLAYIWGKPIIGINHLEGHIYANWLMSPSNAKGRMLKIKDIPFPALCLIVSGGHTELILMKGHNQYQKLGQTHDDAVGEAFDKVAKLLNLGYPGGPIIAKLARKGNSQAFALPRPMINSKDSNFSFSGLKTAVSYLVRDLLSMHHPLPVTDLCASFQQAAIDVLVKKTVQAAKKLVLSGRKGSKIKSVLLSGGVAANKELRQQLAKKIKAELPNVRCQMSDVKFCTDNATMIALAGYFRVVKRDFTPWQKLKINPNLEL